MSHLSVEFRTPRARRVMGLITAAACALGLAPASALAATTPGSGAIVEPVETTPVVVSVRSQYSILSAMDPAHKPSDRDGHLTLSLAIDQHLLETLSARSRTRLVLPLPGASTIERATLELERFEIFTHDAELVEMTPDGPRSLPRPDVQLWRGSVVGDDASRVFLALSPLSSQGYVSIGDRRFSLSTIAPDAPSILAGHTVITDVAELTDAQSTLRAERSARGERTSLLAQPWACAGAILPPGANLPPAMGEVSTSRTDRGPGGACRIIRVAIDTDLAFTSALFAGNTTSSTAYATTLMAAVGSVYSRDVGVTMQVSYLRVWANGSSVPYNAANTGAQLTQFQNFWNSTPPTTNPRDIVHLLSGRSLGGGVAYLSVLCSAGSNYGVSANLGGSFPQPLADNRGGNWDPYVVAHEIGHNFSSGHTHESWAYNPPVDGCGLNFLNPPQPQNCSVAQAGAGTIMSYCHQCPGGVANIDMTFGPRPIAQITGYLANAVPTCGPVLGTPSVAPGMTSSGSQCVGSTVTLSVSATPAPGETLTYTWFRDTLRLLPNSPSISLANLTSSSNGSYTCQISNGCQTVTRGPIAIAICMGDFNCSGGAPSTQDLFDFLAAWFAGDTRADINRMSGIGVQDIFDFMAFWFTGC